MADDTDETHAAQPEGPVVAGPSAGAAVRLRWDLTAYAPYPEAEPTAGSDRALAWFLRAVALVLLVLLLGVLVLIYQRLAGQLPFTFVNGPLGIPPWLPFGVLATVVVAAVAMPKVLAQGRPEPSFRDQIAINRRNCVLLSAALISGLALTAYTVFTVVSLHTVIGLWAAVFVVGAGLIGTAVTWIAGDRIVLAVSSARPIPPGAEPVLENVTNELSIAAGIPVPSLHVIEADAPNALSVGRDPSRASVAVTRGLLKGLPREELQGVIAHEIAHIRNHDSRYGQFVAVLAGTTALLADAFFKIVTFPYWLVKSFVQSGGSADPSGFVGRGSAGHWSFPNLFGGGSGGGGGGGSDSKGGSVLLALLAILIFILMVFIVAWLIKTIAPLFSKIVQASVSRQREYLADASAVEIGRDPVGLENALARIGRDTNVLRVANRATEPLYFINPIHRWEQRASQLFSTHPPTLDRINRLRSLRGVDPMRDSALRDSV